MKRTLGTVQARRRAARDDSPTGRKRYASDEKANRWMVTLNFGGAADMAHLTQAHTLALRRLNAAAQVPPCTYAVFQPECGENGTYHIQGYFEFDKRLTLAQVKKHVGERCHLDPAKGTQEQCIEYCTKLTDLDADPPVYGRVEDGEVVTFGTPMKVNKQGRTSGSRTDWADVWKMVKEGCSNTAILECHPAMIPNVRAIQHARFAVQCETSRDWTTKLLVLWGSPDSGKTTTAISLCEPGKYFIVAADGKGLWWDGYDPMIHETIIFDEFVGSRCPITFLNQLCDCIDVNVQTKGGYTRFLAKRVIITSNFSPREWYAAVTESRQESLWRRIQTEVEFSLVDEIIDLHGDPTKTEKRLVQKVHKGMWHYDVTKSKYPWSEEMLTLVKPRAKPTDSRLNSSMDSEDEVELRKTAVVFPKPADPKVRRALKCVNPGDSQDSPMEISESNGSEELEAVDELSDEDGSASWDTLEALRLARSGRHPLGSADPGIWRKK